MSRDLCINCTGLIWEFSIKFYIWSQGGGRGASEAKRSNHLWTPSLTHQTSTQDPTFDKSHEGGCRGGGGRSNHLWTPSLTHQTSTQDPTFDKSHEGGAGGRSNHLWTPSLTHQTSTQDPTFDKSHEGGAGGGFRIPGPPPLLNPHME